MSDDSQIRIADIDCAPTPKRFPNLEQDYGHPETTTEVSTCKVE
jgi:hypothetical protein